jgi:cobalt/nickel transport protein
LNTAKDSAVAGSPLADYSFVGLDNERISVAIAGIIGVLLTAVVSFGLFSFLKKR